NIEPFIDSFQRLQKQTGSTKTAIMQLLSGAFTGPGALITIVSVVTAAISAIQLGLFDLGEEAKDTIEDLDGLLGSFDRVIEIQEQLGAFEGDEFGIDETRARIREITEDIDEQRSTLQRITELENQRAEIRKQAPDPTARTEEQQKQLDQ